MDDSKIYDHDWSSEMIDCCDKSLKLCLWGVPPPDGPPIGLVLLVHGIGSHSRFEWTRWNNAESTEKLWNTRKTEALKTKGVPIEEQDLKVNTPSPKEKGLFIRNFHLLPPDSPDTQYLPGGTALAKQDYPPQFLEREVCKPPLRFLSKNSWPDALRQLGFQVYLLDQQGHGESESWKNLRCSVKNFDDWSRDILSTTALLYQRHALPYCLCGISMGGLTVVRAVQIYNSKEGTKILGGATLPPPTAVVLLAPALSLKQVIAKNRCAAFFGKPVAALFPNAVVAEKEQNKRYWYIECLASRDPLFWHKSKFRARPSQGLIDYSKIAQQQAEAHFKGPKALLMFHSDEDTMCDPEGSEQFIKKATQVPHRQLCKLDDMWHFLSTEPAALQIRAHVLDFLKTVFTNL